MPVYFDSTGRAVSASTGVSLEHAVDIGVRMMMPFVAVLLVWLIRVVLSARVPNPICAAVLWVFAVSYLMTAAPWIPSQSTSFALLLIAISDHGQNMLVMLLLLTAGTLAFAVFDWFRSR